MHQTSDKTEDRTARQRQPKLLADVVGVGLLALPIAGAERLRQLRAEARIPAFIDPVQDAGELRSVGAAAQQAFEPAAEFGRRDLPGIGRADGGEVRGVDDAAFEEGELVVELEPVDVEGASGAPIRRSDSRGNSP
jgi:hypothetical protein